MQGHGARGVFALHVAARHGQAGEDLLVLGDVLAAERQEFGDAEAGVDAQEKQGAVPQGVPAAKGLQDQVHFVVGEGATAGHRGLLCECDVL